MGVFSIRRAREQGSLSERNGELGFSMLEAVVAVGVLGICLLPLLDFQMSVSGGAGRLVERQALMEAERRAEEYVRSIPPSALAGGTADFGEWQLTWQELNRAPSRNALSEQGGTARFQISVVRMEYQVEFLSGAKSKNQLDRLYWVPVTRLFDAN